MLLIGTAWATTYVVDASGTGDFDTIQAGIDAATDGDVVEVLAGYYPEAIDFSGKGVTVASRDGAALTFLTGDGTTSDLVTFEQGEDTASVLRGFTLQNPGRRGVRVSRAGPTLEELVIQDVGYGSVRTYVGTGAGVYVESGTPVLRDVTFDDVSDEEGASLYVDVDSDVTMSEITLVGGFSTGAAIRVLGAATISDCAVSGHWSDLGALTVSGGAVSVSACSFDANNGDYNEGAAIQVDGGTLTVDDTSFTSNWASYGLYYDLDGGAIYVGAGGSATVRSSTFSRNVSGYGGAIATHGSLTVEDSTFSANGAYYGQAISVRSGGSLRVGHSTFESHTAYAVYGGAVYANAAAEIVVSDSRFCGNVTDYASGGAVWISGTVGADTWTNNVFVENTAVTEGGALYVSGESAASFLDNTLVGNNAATGGAVYLASTAPTFTNNLVAFNAAGDGVYDATGHAASGTLTYNDWWSNTTADVAGYLTAADISSGGNLFVDPLLAGFSLNGLCDDDLSLDAGSPLLDAGDPAYIDADGTVADIGADPGDQDGDGWEAPEDCDDGDAAVNPDAAEVENDGIDQDCDGLDVDADGDGWDQAEDCDDDDAGVNPGATEVWYDGVDQDCDGIDDDADGDGWGVAQDCDDGDGTVNPAAEETWYDGVDQDCDGVDDDADGDGSGVAEDCDDTDPAVQVCPDSGDSAGTDSGDSAPLGGDSGDSGGDTGEGAEKPGCGCGNAGRASLVWILVAGVVGRRRAS